MYRLCFAGHYSNSAYLMFSYLYLVEGIVLCCCVMSHPSHRDKEDVSPLKLGLEPYPSFSCMYVCILNFYGGDGRKIHCVFRTETNMHIFQHPPTPHHTTKPAPPRPISSQAKEESTLQLH